MNNEECPACEFRADGVLIRPWRHRDADALYEAASESIATVGRWLPWCHDRYTKADSKAWIEFCLSTWKDGGQYAFAILAPDESRVFGGVGLNKFDAARRTANLGYWIRSTAQNRGIATQAVRLASGFGFGQEFTRLEIAVALDNAASRRVAEKSGAYFEGIASDRIEFRGKRLDAAVYVLATPEQNVA